MKMIVVHKFKAVGEDVKPTNQITSTMDMKDDKSKANPLQIIRKGRLAKSFYKLVEKSGDDDFTKQALRSNGKNYQQPLQNFSKWK